MVSLTSFRNVGQHISLVGFLGSAIALITSTIHLRQFKDCQSLHAIRHPLLVFVRQD